MITPRQWEKYWNLRREGFAMRAAATEAGMSYATARAKEANLRNSSGGEWVATKRADKLPGPIPYEQLSPEARDCLVDFERFRAKLLGHVSTKWQVETAQDVRRWIASPEKEYVVENCPPGVGKTTLAHDIGAWLTAGDRGMRGLFGSRVGRNARRSLMRLRRTLERTSPVKAKPELVARGLAVDAEACMAQYYGLFKPTGSEVWRSDEFIVAQFDDTPIEEKEPTWSSYGMDEGQLGNRYLFIVWDDVVDRTTIRTLDAQEAQRAWWDDEGETRLEPGGLMWLIGQRMGPSDLYRYNLDKRVELEEGDEEAEGHEYERGRPVYRHVVYKAHDESRCRGDETHRKDAPAQPEGCLLDPVRLPWKGRAGLRALASTKKRTYEVSYQQEDVDPEQTLLREVWITGGTDPEDGTMCPGCWDEDRDLCELPAGLTGPKYSIATVDPSPTKMWAVQWWVHAPAGGDQSFLMDLERKAMPANELLDWDANSGRWYGLMEEWQVRSQELGLPITTWIVEVNAAQRFLLAYDHVRRWMSHHGVAILPHTTGPRKLDPEHGPWIIRDHFRYGRVRLPGAQAYHSKARFTSLKLVDEGVRWPNAGTTDDCVMGCWFYFTHLPRLSRPKVVPIRRHRPAWLGDKETALAVLH